MPTKNPQNRSSKINIRYMVQLSLLFAIQIVLVATPLGFMPIGPIDITLVHLPTLIGAITMGPAAGGVLGTVFGVSSLITATLRSGTPSSFFFSPFVSGSLWSVVISIVPRVLLGLLAGWIFAALSKTNLKTRVVAGLSAGISYPIHSILVLGGIYLFFGQKYAEILNVPQSGLFAVIVLILMQNGLIETALAVILCVALAPVLLLIQKRKS